MKKIMWIIFMLVGHFVSAQIVSQTRIMMTYEGGYSTVKRVEIHLTQRGDVIDYTTKKEYYSQEEPAEQRKGTVSKENFNTLMQILEKNDVWELPDLTEYVATDGFTYTVQISQNQKVHSFKVYFPGLQNDRRYQQIVHAIKEIIPVSL